MNQFKYAAWLLTIWLWDHPYVQIIAGGIALLGTYLVWGIK